MNLRTDRDVADCHRIARAKCRHFAVTNRVADLQAKRRDDVTLLAIFVLEQRNTRTAIRVVLDRDDFGTHIELVALEVDQTIAALMSTATMPHRNTPPVITSTTLTQWLGERAFRPRFRDFLKTVPRHPAATRRCGLVHFYRHQLTLKRQTT